MANAKGMGGGFGSAKAKSSPPDKGLSTKKQLKAMIDNFKRHDESKDGQIADVYVARQGGEIWTYCGQVSAAAGGSLDAAVNAQKKVIYTLAETLPSLRGSKAMAAAIAPSNTVDAVIAGSDGDSLRPVQYDGDGVGTPVDSKGFGYKVHVYNPDAKKFIVERKLGS